MNAIMKPLVILTALLALLCQSALTAERPNVLFLAVDDMNDWIGCLGKTPRAITPNIDKLARNGVNFTNAHSPQLDKESGSRAHTKTFDLTIMGN